MSGDMVEVSRILVAFLVFALILVRIGCIVLFAPFFASDLFPGRFRLLFISGFSLLLVPAAARTAAIPPVLDMLQLGVLAGQEFAIGMAMGFLASLVFTGVQLAGEIAGQQIGFSMANVVDPMSNVEVPILGFVNMNLAMMLFLSANLHLVLAYVMAQSYEFVGIGALVPEVALDPVLRMSMDQARMILLVGVQLSVPIMLIMLMESVVEGFITKTMPQMNIMVLGMPLKVALGVAALIFVYPAICVALVPSGWRVSFTDMPPGPMGDMLVDLSGMVREMGGGRGLGGE